MKNLMRKSLLVASFVIALATSAFQTYAQDDKLVYDKKTNMDIGITVENATGADYVIKDRKGNVVWKGKVKSGKRFFIPISKLNAGTYRFYIGHLMVQEFSVQ